MKINRRTAAVSGSALVISTLGVVLGVALAGGGGKSAPPAPQVVQPVAASVTTPAPSTTHTQKRAVVKAAETSEDPVDETSDTSQLVDIQTATPGEESGVIRAPRPTVTIPPAGPPVGFPTPYPSSTTTGP